MRENEGKIFQDSVAGISKRRKYDKGASCSSKAKGDGQPLKTKKNEKSDGHPPSKKLDGHPPSKKAAKKNKKEKKMKKSSDRCHAAMKAQEQGELRLAARQSCVDSGITMSKRKYRATVDVSDDEEEIFLNAIVAKANKIEKKTTGLLSSSEDDADSQHVAFGFSSISQDEDPTLAAVAATALVAGVNLHPDLSFADALQFSADTASSYRGDSTQFKSEDESASFPLFRDDDSTRSEYEPDLAAPTHYNSVKSEDESAPPSHDDDSTHSEDEPDAAAPTSHDNSGESDDQEPEEHDDDDGKDDEGDGNGDDDDIPSSPVAPTRGRKKKRKTVTEPDSDNDPDPPNPRQKNYAPDRHGWSRSLEQVKVEPFAGPSPTGPTFPPLAAPVDYFLKFFPLYLIIQIATWTTTILLKAGKKATTAAEIQAWIGCRLVMGLVKIPNYQDYWSTETAYFNGQIAGTMTRQRYDDVNAFLACNDPALDPENYPTEDPTMFTDKKHKYCWMRNHPLYPLQPVWDTVLECCQKNYNMARHISIDEAMVKYSGFKAQVRKFFMPLKPIRAGFKLYAMAEATTGYLFNFITHPWKSGTPAKMIDITMEVAKPILGRYHHIFTDKLYTSMALGRLLLSRSTYLTGAVKSNSKGLPVDLLKDAKKNPKHLKLKRLSKTKRGTFYSRQNNNFTSVVWKDSSIMQLLSSAHQGYRTKPTANTPGDVVTRQVKADGERRRTTTIVSAPRQAVDYVKYMGGVDRADQLRSYYSCSRKSQQWWKKLLFFTIDIAVSNAWLCYKWHNPTTEPAESDDDDREEAQSARLSHSQFVLAIAKGLIYGTNQPRRDPHQAKYQPLPAHHGVGTDHRSENLMNKHARQCQWCKRHGGTNPSGNIPTTRHGCKICNVNLCRPPRRCFLAYHGGE